MIVLLTLADRAVLALFMGGDSPALPIARHIHVVATWNFLLVRGDDGAVRHGPRERCRVVADDRPRDRPRSPVRFG